MARVIASQPMKQIYNLLSDQCQHDQFLVTNLGAGAEVGHFVVKESINLSFFVYEAPN